MCFRLYTLLHLLLSGLQKETHVYAVQGERKLKLDIYRPKSADGPVPVIVFTHGGGWAIGMRRLIEPAFVHQVKRGYALVSLTYSLTRKASWPAQIHETKAAYRWVRANAKRFGFDPGKLIAAGGSAGGHLACVAALSGPGNLEGDLGNAETSSDVSGVAAFYPPTDLISINNKGLLGKHTIEALLGGAVSDQERALVEATPATHVRADAPPLLIMHGTIDQVVPFEQGAAIVDAVNAAGGQAELVKMPGIAHADWRFNAKRYRKSLEAFLDRVSGKNQVNAK